LSLTLCLGLVSSIVHGKKKKKAGNKKFNQAILKRHNFYRTIGGIAKMKWDKKIAKNAQKWARSLKKTNKCNMQHSSSTFRSKVKGFSYLGENLHWAWSSVASKVNPKTGKKAVDDWYSEIAFYKYSKKGVVCPLRGKKGAIGHFTQVMWDTSKNLGCAYAQCGNGKTTVIVCQYGPGGNFNQHKTPPFSPKAANKLNKHKVNKKFGGLPRCD